jgi:UDP-glucose 4-epimerase
VTIFITGGSGYIGKHLVDFYQKQNSSVFIIDTIDPDFDLSSKTLFVKLDISTKDSVGKLRELFSQAEIGSILIHLAGKKSVEESFSSPDLYFSSNVGCTENLLLALEFFPEIEIVFASTAAVYGDIDYSKPIIESEICQPISPYATSKLQAENLLLASKHRVAILRFFNVAGATKEEFMEQVGPNLIPASIRMIESGRAIQIFGNDYDTPDGTCIRDYIHIEDLIQAIVKASEVLKENGIGIINIGSGIGYSVLQIITEIENLSVKSVEINYLPKRDGDVAKVIADINKARNLLNWRPIYGVREMVLSSIPRNSRKP